MAHDSDFFRRRATEARNAAFQKGDGESAEVAGYLALAYSALARRRKNSHPTESADAVDAAGASVADDIPLMLRD